MTREKLAHVISTLIGFDISLPSRKHDHVVARWIYCKIVNEELDYCSLESIGKTIKRDHATVLHALKKVDNEMAKNFKLKSLYLRVLAVKDLYEESGEEVDFDSVLTLEDAKDRYEVKINNITSFYSKKLEELRAKGNHISPMFDFLIQIPEDKIEHFKETRLIPYLRMNKVKTA